MQTQQLYQPLRQNEVLVPFFIVTKTTKQKLYQPPRQNEVLVPFFIVTKMTKQKLYQPPRQMRLVTGPTKHGLHRHHTTTCQSLHRYKGKNCDCTSTRRAPHITNRPGKGKNSDCTSATQTPHRTHRPVTAPHHTTTPLHNE